MASGPRYRVRTKRRRNGQTMYHRRLKLLKGKTTRFVVRLTNKNVICQLVDYLPQGDKTLATATSKSLSEYGWKGGLSNTSAAYLTGFLLGKKANAEKAILDIGLHAEVKGSRVYAAAKGLQDAGVEIPLGDVSPDESRLTGSHIQEYAKSIDDAARKVKFSAYYKNNIDPTKFVDHFNEVKKKIEGAK
ncbi:50S ribosomal protein L18 [Candidatus Undinarchaeota archaeon]